MLGQTIQEAMNDQIKQEFYSAYLYLAMSAYCESINLEGLARWMHAQAREETEHAMKFFHFIQDRGGRVVLQAIDQPPVQFQSPLQVFEQALDHEQQVTSLIHRLYGLAVQEQDYASQTFLQWFVTEQIEEEKNAHLIVEQLKLSGDSRAALLMLDRELGQRQAAHGVV